MVFPRSTAPKPAATSHREPAPAALGVGDPKRFQISVRTAGFGQPCAQHRPWDRQHACGCVARKPLDIHEEQRKPVMQEWCLERGGVLIRDRRGRGDPPGSGHAPARGVGPGPTKVKRPELLLKPRGQRAPQTHHADSVLRRDDSPMTRPRTPTISAWESTGANTGSDMRGMRSVGDQPVATGGRVPEDCYALRTPVRTRVVRSRQLPTSPHRAVGCVHPVTRECQADEPSTRLPQPGTHVAHARSPTAAPAHHHPNRRDGVPNNMTGTTGRGIEVGRYHDRPSHRTVILTCYAGTDR